MSTRRPTPDLLDDVLGANVSGADGSSEAEIGIPVFQPAQPAAKTRAPRPKTQITPAAASDPAPPAPLVIKPVEWEYRELIVREYRGWRVRFVDGRERGGWKDGPTLREYLEQAGKEGWELVSLSERRHNQKEAYLKRAK
jgi:hypothetical protein